MRALALPVFRARSRFPAQKRSLFSVNALVVIGQELSIHAGLRDSGLQRNYTSQTPVQPGGSALLAAEQSCTKIFCGLYSVQ